MTTIEKMIRECQDTGITATLRHATTGEIVRLDIDALRVLQAHYMLQRDVKPKLEWLEPEPIDTPRPVRGLAVDHE